MNDRRLALNDGGVVGNISRDRTPRADPNVIADLYIAYDRRARPNINVVADGGEAGILTVDQSVAANRDVLKDRAARAELCKDRYRNAFEAMRRRKTIY